MDVPAFAPIQSREVRFANGSWTIFSSVEVNLEASAWRILEPLAEESLAPFRHQVDLDGVCLLAAFFPQQREIRLCHPVLGQELFLVKHGSEDGPPEWRTFCEHVRRVLELPMTESPTVWQLVTKAEKLPDLLEDRWRKMEKEVGERAEELLQKMRAYRSSWFERISDGALNLTAHFALLRIHLLKFLAILPSLDHDRQGGEVKRVLLESLRRLISDHRAKVARPLPFWIASSVAICRVILVCIPAGLLAPTVRLLVQVAARRFIAGESIDQAETSLRSLRDSGRDATLDRLGELVVSEVEADRYMEEVLEMVEGLARQIPRGERNSSGINRAHISIKMSALCRDFRPEAFDAVYARVAPRLAKILLIAKQEEVFINIDAEHYAYRDLTFNIYRKVLLETPGLEDYADTGIVLQAYLRDGAKHLRDILALAKERKLTMPIRLVKGAYWDAETVEAEAHSFDAPEFLNKEETDLHYRQLIIEILASYPHLQLCLAGHNFADHCFGEILCRRDYPNHPPIEHQCLHMTYEALSVGMARMGWVVRNYVPVGSLLVGMAYLVRRIMENSSQVGVLTIMRSHRNSQGLIPPMDAYSTKLDRGDWKRDSSQVKLDGEFAPIAPLRPHLLEEWGSFERAMERFRQERLGWEYESAFSLHGPLEDIFSPGAPEVLVGRITFACKEDVSRAIEIADSAFKRGDWADLSAFWRASVLLRAASFLAIERNSLAALIVYEAGKTIPEALADVDEAVDFVNFYAREAFQRPNTMAARGVVAAISPWNFPLAIPCGMISAPLAMGNAVILKSAEQTPLVAARLVDIFHRAGVPATSLIHLPGPGESVGATLVESERVSCIAFTGSRAVGEMISSRAGRRLYHNQRSGHSYPVKVVAEMGGKNAIIVTANAEPDETVAGILFSAFGHAGQKCSAASRVIVDERIKDLLLERLSQAIKDLQVGRPFDPDCVVNPLIRQEERQRLLGQIADIRRETQEFGGKVHVDRSAEELPGWCFGPCLIELPLERALHSESYARRELFGPVLHLIPFKGLDNALKLFNSTDYALTGGVFSQSQDDIDYLTERMEAGNIYVNRNITGARVAIEPFGGFKFSGTGPKSTLR